LNATQKYTWFFTRGQLLTFAKVVRQILVGHVVRVRTAGGIPFVAAGKGREQHDARNPGAALGLVGTRVNDTVVGNEDAAHVPRVVVAAAAAAAAVVAVAVRVAVVDPVGVQDGSHARQQLVSRQRHRRRKLQDLSKLGTGVGVYLQQFESLGRSQSSGCRRGGGGGRRRGGGGGGGRGVTALLLRAVLFSLDAVVVGQGTVDQRGVGVVGQGHHHLHLTRQQIHVGSLFLFRTDLGERTNENEENKENERVVSVVHKSMVNVQKCERYTFDTYQCDDVGGHGDISITVFGGNVFDGLLKAFDETSTFSAEQEWLLLFCFVYGSTVVVGGGIAIVGSASCGASCTLATLAAFAALANLIVNDRCAFMMFSFQIIDFPSDGLLNTNHIALVVFDNDFIPFNFCRKIVRLNTNSNDDFFELFDGMFLLKHR
jgi:hypothetical protein